MSHVWQTPDTVARLRRAAQHRFEEADSLLKAEHNTAAVLLLGHVIEMILGASFFFRAGFSKDRIIEKDIRTSRMSQARNERLDGRKIMGGDPHDLPGWARFIRWLRSIDGNIAPQDSNHLRTAVEYAEEVYEVWRPELRYKASRVESDTAARVRSRAKWFVDNREKLESLHNNDDI